MAASHNVRAGRAYVEIAADSSKLQRSLTNARQQLRDFGRAARDVGREMLAISTVMAAPFALATRSFASFDDTMRLVQGVTGATGAAFERLTEKAAQLGRETSYTAQQAADAMVALGRMGFTPAEIDDAIGSVLSLARATGTELAEAADFAANSMRIFGISAADMARVADVLSVTANSSAQTLTDLFEGLKIAGPQAKAANESLEETAAALGVLANMGIKGSLAGTALRKSFSQFANVDVQTYLADFGVSTVDTAGNLRKLKDVMLDIAGVMQTLSSADRIAFAEEVFDLRGSLAGLSITADPSALVDFTNKLKDVAGAADATAKKMDEGLGGSFRLLTSAAEGSMNAIGSAMAETLQPLTNELTATINSFTRWIEANKSLVTTLGLVAGAGAVLGTALIAIGTAAKLAASGITAIKYAGSGLGKIYNAGAAALARYSAFCGTASTGTVALKTALFSLKAVGIIGIIGGIVAAYSALTARTKKAAELTAELKDEMQQARIAGDAMRKSDNERAKRLQELANKGRLSNEEMREAKTILGELEGRYNRFGARLDTVNNTLTMTARAQQNLNKAMRGAHVQQLEAELAEAEANAAKARAVFGEMESFFTRWGYSAKWSLQGAADDMQSVLRQIDAAEARVRAAQDKLNAARAGNDMPEDTIAGPSAAEIEAQIANEADARIEAEEAAAKRERTTLEKRKQLKEEAAAAEKRVAEIEAQLQKERQTDLENEIDEIHALADEYIRLLEALRQYELNKKEVDGAAVQALEARIRAVDAETAQRVDAAKAKAAEENASAVKDVEEEYTRTNTANERDTLNRRLEELQKRNSAAAVSLLERLLQRLTPAVEKAAAEYRAAIDAAKADGAITDVEAATIQRARDLFTDLNALRGQYAERLERAREGVERERGKNSASAVGSFYAAAMRNLGASTADKQLKAAEKTAANTQQTVRLLESLADNALVFAQ